MTKNGRREDKIEIRINAKEREMFQLLADRHGLGIAGWVRNYMHDAYRREIEQDGQAAA